MGDIKGFHMPTFGFRFRLRNDQNQRSWTELWYKDFGSLSLADPGVKTAVTAVARRRAGCLADGNVLVDITVFNPAVPRTAITYEVNLPGVIGQWVEGVVDGEQDIAPAAALLKLSSATSYRQYLMRGIADKDVRLGVFQPQATTLPSYRQWWNYIVSAQLQVAKRPNAGVIVPIATVQTGSITTVNVIGAGIVADDTLKIVTRVAGNGPRVRTTLRATATSAGNSVPVDWSHGNCEGGAFVKIGFDYENIVSYAVREAARTRKTGGPLGKFRGRH